VIVANLHETYNFLNKYVSLNIKNKDLLKNYELILRIMNPILPHITSECLWELKTKDSYKWPMVDLKFLQKDDVNIVIQINGKKRSIINTIKDIEEKQLIIKIKEDPRVKKFLEDRVILKSILIKNKLINLIIK